VKAQLKGLLESIGEQVDTCFGVVLADGSTFESRAGAPEFTFVFRSRQAQWRVLAFGHVGLLESYFDGGLDIEGSLAAAFAVGMKSRFDRRSNLPVRIRNHWHELRYSNRTIGRAKVNARFHYGLGADFYRHWLDVPLMMYTCAYWKEGTRTLEEAQRNKIDHVCRKIQLKAGETFVDIGCGFGGFLFHAWENHGALGTGVNITTEQVDWLRDELGRRGLKHQIQVREADFREVHARFDKVVSIGVLEHAGRDQLAEVVRAHAKFLKPGGLGMLHYIGHVGVRDTEFFIRRHVFPGGWIPSLAETIVEMENCGLEVVDIENLRRHYALTLDAWAERFERNWKKIQALDARRFDERFRRVWRAYLYGCAEMFRSPAGRTHLFQIVFSKGNIALNSYPMSRRFLYERAAERAAAAARTLAV